MRKYKEGTLALVTYAILTLIGVFLAAWFDLEVAEGILGLGLALVGFLSGLLKAEEEVGPYAGALVLGADAVYLAVRLSGDKGMLALVVLSFFFGVALFAQVLRARRLEEIPAPKQGK